MNILNVRNLPVLKSFRSRSLASRSCESRLRAECVSPGYRREKGTHLHQGEGTKTHDATQPELPHKDRLASELVEHIEHIERKESARSNHSEAEAWHRVVVNQDSELNVYHQDIDARKAPISTRGREPRRMTQINRSFHTKTGSPVSSLNILNILNVKESARSNHSEAEAWHRVVVNQDSELNVYHQDIDAKRHPSPPGGSRDQRRMTQINRSFQSRLSQDPELPLPQCTLTTELLRLRGGPYHSLSYARLRVSERLRQGVGVLNASAADSGAWLAVDHDCDGGRWICIGSYQTIYPKVHELSCPCGASGALIMFLASRANTPCAPR